MYYSIYYILILYTIYITIYSILHTIHLSIYPLNLVNDCLNANYNEEVFKKYVNELGYAFEITTKKDGLFR